MERPKLNPPPHNGIGSEEDSLGSCMSLTPKPPRKDIHKILANNGKTLRFQARLDNQNPEDKERSFVITFYLADDTVAVYEPPRRNSGIIGGKFLKRQRMKNSRQQYWRAQDFFVGARTSFFSFKFIIEGTDNYTLKYMEENRDRFPMANIGVILKKLTRLFKHLDPAREFQKHDTDNSGVISRVEFEEMIYQHITATEITKQEILTIMRFFDSDGSGSIGKAEFLSQMDSAKASDHIIESFNVETENYSDKTDAVDEEDLEQQKRVAALGFFKKKAKGKRAQMIQYYRMADVKLQESITTEAVVDIMHTLLAIEKRDAERVCKEFFGDKHTSKVVSSAHSQLAVSVVPFHAYLELLDSAGA